LVEIDECGEDLLALILEPAVERRVRCSELTVAVNRVGAFQIDHDHVTSRRLNQEDLFPCQSLRSARFSHLSLTGGVGLSGKLARCVGCAWLQWRGESEAFPA